MTQAGDRQAPMTGNVSVGGNMDDIAVVNQTGDAAGAQQSGQVGNFGDGIEEPNLSVGQIDSFGDGNDSSSAALVRALVQRGIDPSKYGITSDDEAVATLADILERWDDIYQLSLVGASAMRNWDKIKDILSGNGQTAAAQVQPQAPVKQQEPNPEPEDEYWPKPPEWNQEWSQYLRIDENGNIVPISPLHSKYAEAYNSYVKWQQDAARKIINDPIGLVLNSPHFKKAVEEAITNALQARQSQDEILNTLKNHMDLFFATGQNGNVLVDPLTGQPMLSPTGQFVHEFLTVAKSGDIKTLLPIAISIAKLMNNDQGAQQAAPGDNGNDLLPAPRYREDQTKEPPKINPGAVRRNSRSVNLGVGSTANRGTPVGFGELLKAEAIKHGLVS